MQLFPSSLSFEWHSVLVLTGTRCWAGDAAAGRTPRACARADVRAGRARGRGHARGHARGLERGRGVHAPGPCVEISLTKPRIEVILTKPPRKPPQLEYTYTRLPLCTYMTVEEVLAWVNSLDDARGLAQRPIAPTGVPAPQPAPRAMGHCARPLHPSLAPVPCTRPLRPSLAPAPSSHSGMSAGKTHLCTMKRPRDSSPTVHKYVFPADLIGAEPPTCIVELVKRE